jgi:hypothetical protein
VNPYPYIHLAIAVVAALVALIELRH